MTLKRILLPTDFSNMSAGVALHARLLAGRCGAELVVMHVIASRPVADVFDAAETAESWKAGCWSRMKEMYSDKSFVGQRLLPEGDPAEAIVNYANEQRVDVIMMAAGGRSLRHSSPGRVTANTLDHANCPVWTTAHAADNNGHAPALPKDIVCAIDLDIGSERVVRWAVDLAVACGSRLTVAHVARNVVADVVRSVAEERKAGLVIIGRPQSGKRAAGTASCRAIRQAPCPVVIV